jgi:two-component system, chemotaxis family, protein-glutamate methylesterase/glutaminase
MPSETNRCGDPNARPGASSGECPRSPNARREISVLVVDDSAVVRQVMASVLSQEPGMNVAVAADPLIAMDKMKRQRPDVILLDLEMPRMDGLTFLRKIMAEDPIPVIVCSALAPPGSDYALSALDDGALDVIAKPTVGVKSFLYESAVLLIDSVRSAAQARLRPRGLPTSLLAPKNSADVVLPSRPAPVDGLRITTDKVVVVGASTGGTEAIREFLETMPADAPAIVIVQHMPEAFTAGFARRLDSMCPIEVKEAGAGDRVLQGRALIAPGNRHTMLRRSGGHYVVDVAEGPLVSRHRPSVDVLFRSAAQAAGPNAIGVIMTGMGDDGAAGLLEMKLAGAWTVAQDEASCVVYGMPKEAVLRGAVNEVSPLSNLSRTVLDRVRLSAANRRPFSSASPTDVTSA